MAPSVKPEVDWERLQAILDGPGGGSIPPALRARMEADIAKNRPSGTQAPVMAPRESTVAPVAGPPAAPTPPQPPVFSPSDVTTIANEFDAQARHQRAIQVAKENTQGWRNKIATTAMQVPIMAMQVGHDLTLGIAPSPYGERADPQTMDSITAGAQIPIKILSALGTTMLQGYGLMRGLSFVGKVPIAARALEFIPMRLKEIGLGALVNGGIDALRTDGLARDPVTGEIQDSWLDPSSKIAKPLAEMGVPDRLALGMGGAVVGGVMGPMFMGIAAGYNRARTLAVVHLSDETINSIRQGLTAAGVSPGQIGEKYAVAKHFLTNLRKVALNEEASEVIADQLSREQFIANEIRASGAAPTASKAVAEVMRGQGDLANSGFFIKPDAAVHLPDAASIQVPTVEAVKNAIKRVGPEEFQRRVQSEMLNRSADPLAQAAATEEVARRIVAQPEGTKSAHELLQEIQGTAFADTPAHKAALKYANDISGPISAYPQDVPKEAIRDRMLRDKLFNADGSEFNPEPKIPKKPGGPVIPGGGKPAGRPIVNEGPMDIQLRQAGELDKAVAKVDLASDIELDGRLLAGIFRQNPGGINIVTGVKHDAALLAAQERLGVKLTVAKIPTAAAGVHDYMIGRPVYNYPEFGNKNVFGTNTVKLTNTLKKMATEASKSVTAPKTTEAFILADGTPIRGGLNTGAMIEKMRMQKPVVNGVGRGDLSLQHLGNLVRMEIGENNTLHVTLPPNLSKEQFRSLGKAIDTMKFEEVTIARGQTEKTFQTPLGAVVQDHVAQMIKPQSISNSITPDMAMQYGKEGIFRGQAAILPDGSAAEILGRDAKGIKVKETMTGSEVVVHEKNLTILPSSLEGEYRGSNLFASYLTDGERQSLAKMRLAMTKGWAQEITKYREFESFASSRGYIAENMKGGKIRLAKANEGGAEPMLFKDLKSALAWVRKDTSPMAELGSDEITRLLGPDRNMGYIGGGGPPPRMNEMLPIDWKRMEATMGQLPADAGPTTSQLALKPMIPLMRDLDKKFGTEMYKAASNMQSQKVARSNFEALWFKGVGGKLPEGVMPLEKIIKLAGPKANQELITDFREADAVGRIELAKQMSPREVRAAEELGKWYDAAYPALGVGAPFVENYMPHYRQAVQSGNPTSFQDFMAQMVGKGQTVPRGTDWVSDHIREGLIDVYNKDAFGVAVQYLRAGAKNRFMKQAQDEAREMVRMVAAKSPNLALPLANMLQAMGGYEFAEQRVAMKAMFESIMDKLPHSMTREGKSSLADRFVDWTTSLVYSSTMGFRPALALRNAKDIWVMSYPLYHGPRFNEAIGYALTKEGKAEAIAARVINKYSGGLLSADEETRALLAKLPKRLQDMHEASTMLYDSADEFTRTGTYFAAKFKAEEALQTFAKAVEKKGTSDVVLERLKENLIRDAKVYIHGPEASEEFIRRATNDPHFAAKYAGKLAADYTNYLYGRGMQARWMRSMGGRLLGQFGTWSMWYGDYLTQQIKAIAKGPYKADAFGILARHALVNAAILEVGREVLNVDLSRWASYGALAYSGGPGLQVAMGASTLMRGLGEVSSFGEDPLGETRVSQGSQMIWNTLPAFVPYHSAFRDVSKMVGAYDQVDFLAATLGTRVTKDYQIRRKIEIMTDMPGLQGYGMTSGPFQSTSPALGTMLNNMATGTGEQPVDLRVQGAAQSAGVQAPPTPPKPQPGGTMMRSRKNRPLEADVPANSMPQTMETKPTGSKPVGGY